MQNDRQCVEFYYIMQGDCVVNMVDEYKNIEHIAFKLLTEGDHFGEIGMIY